MRMIKHIAAPMTAPSPLVGEGITAGQRNLSWVRGTGANAVPRTPLTRLRGVYHRAALRADPVAKPPAPTRGEGKIAAPRLCQPATHGLP
jgi:hypothetical protein